MAKTPSELIKNPIPLMRPLTATTKEEYVTESQYILDATKKQTLQQTIDELEQNKGEWATGDEVDGMFTLCPSVTE